MENGNRSIEELNPIEEIGKIISTLRSALENVLNNGDAVDGQLINSTIIKLSKIEHAINNGELVEEINQLLTEIEINKTEKEIISILIKLIEILRTIEKRILNTEIINRIPISVKLFRKTENDLVLEMCNEESWKLLKINKEERPDLPISMTEFHERYGQIFSIDLEENEGKQIMKKITTGKGATYSKLATHKDGSTYYIEIQINKLTNELFLVTKRDKSVEEELRSKIDRLNDEFKRYYEIISANGELIIELENKVSELENNNLSNEQIINWYSQIISLISHDVMSSFNAISLANELKEEYEHLSDSERIEIINLLYSSAENTRIILKDLIDRARSENRDPIILQNSVKDIVTKTILNSKIKADKKKIQINCKVDQEFALFDKGDFEIILRNLVQNAIKFCHQNTGKIDILANTNSADNFVELFIKDNGIGMDENAINHIYEGTKDSTNGTNNEVGTGNGLKFVKNLIERNNCKLRIESKKGEGTTFIISIPAEYKERKVNKDQ